MYIVQNNFCNLKTHHIRLFEIFRFFSVLSTSMHPDSLSNSFPSLALILPYYKCRRLNC